MDIFVIEKNHVMLEKIIKYFKNDDVLNITAFTDSGKYGVDCISKLLPQVVLIDISNDNGILEYLENTGGIDPNIFGIVISNKRNDFSVLNAHRLGFDKVMMQPLELESLKNILMEYYKKNKNACLSQSYLEKTVRDILNKTGITSSLTGYKYLRHAIMLCYRNETMLNNITKMLYPSVAEHFSSSIRHTERCMSKAVETAWKNQGENDFYKRMGCNIKDETKKPTNKKFISVIVEYIKSNT